MNKPAHEYGFLREFQERGEDNSVEALTRRRDAFIRRIDAQNALRDPSAEAGERK